MIVMNDFSGSVAPNNMPLLRKLLSVLAITTERELACAEAAALLDYYVELEARGEDVARLLPEINQHLRICPDCEEEHAALRAIIGSDPIPA